METNSLENSYGHERSSLVERFCLAKILRLTNSVRIGLSEDLRDTVNLRDTVKNEESL